MCINFPTRSCGGLAWQGANKSKIRCDLRADPKSSRSAKVMCELRAKIEVNAISMKYLCGKPRTISKGVWGCHTSLGKGVVSKSSHLLANCYDLLGTSATFGYKVINHLICPVIDYLICPIRYRAYFDHKSSSLGKLHLHILRLYKKIRNSSAEVL